MTTKPNKRPHWSDDMCLGQVQAYCVAGGTVEIQRERLSQVPESVREQVRGHMNTVRDIKIKQRNKRLREEGKRKK